MVGSWMGEAHFGLCPFKPNFLCLAAIWLHVRIVSRLFWLIFPLRENFLPLRPIFEWDFGLSPPLLP
jgi:hypothetical protein